MHKVFIDGEAGTTGLQIVQRLEKRADIELIRLSETNRKEPAARTDAINSSDVTILCLPDMAAKEAVSLATQGGVKIIDASTAHRTNGDWVYGFAEMCEGQRDAIKTASRISNPGCYATAFIALMRPLVTEGLVAPFWPTYCNAVSGYSGGGKSMIEEFQGAASKEAFRPYALNLNHKHLPEMTIYSGLESPPLFTPNVGRFYQGMCVEIPLQLWALPDEPSLSQIHSLFSDYYRNEAFIKIISPETLSDIKSLDPEAANGTNQLLIYVLGDQEAQQARLVCILDNLGKGASGAAVQNLNLALGVDEDLGLI